MRSAHSSARFASFEARALSLWSSHFFPLLALQSSHFVPGGGSEVSLAQGKPSPIEGHQSPGAGKQAVLSAWASGFRRSSLLRLSVLRESLYLPYIFEVGGPT